ncbi:DUF1707 SHOCT-like domain-containing protein [Geodermatophilus marinus]|uniref:DUF1707 SHOCT-like domain-containing protein n=1 Tax=Geodermatophilus sp. LHW52908 TaxID=2303986 RepID=UPI0018F78A90|nr:DUF1707 domain-containing protein [Geodermatophilus sp. LHW52908]
MPPPTDRDGLARPALRASDADRTATVQVLQDAVARGLLTADEGSERMAAAFAAVHLADLSPLTADLPPAPQPPAPPGWPAVAALAAAQLRASLGGARWRLTGARIAVVLLAVLVAVLLLAAVGSLAAEVLVDGGGPFDEGGPVGGEGPGRWGPGRG